MKKILLLVPILVAACERAPEADTLPADSAAVTANEPTLPTGDSAPAQGARAAAPTQFDPKSVKPGARYGGLTVADVKLQPAQTETGQSGSVTFSGQAQIDGSYRAHFDYPEVKEPCFWVDLQSWDKLPRAQGDKRIIWFCFSNKEDAIRQLGQLGSQARATIVIDNYTTHLSGSDAWDTARLVRVVRKEAF